MPRKLSYAQNGEDIRVWRAFAQARPGQPWFFVDVGANEPRHLSISASLSDLGWTGLLIEADPVLASELRRFRPGDTVVECAVARAEGHLTFHAVPGTGLGTVDADQARAAADRGFATHVVTVPARTLTSVLEEYRPDAPIHFMTIDVEGSEADVLAGLDLDRFRPWVLCIEAIAPGTDIPSHGAWEGMLTSASYALAAFDGVNRWYVAEEHADLAQSIAVPFNALDAGRDGWEIADASSARSRVERDVARHAWQREILLNEVRSGVPVREYELQIAELRTALSMVEASRSWRYSRRAGAAARRISGRLKAAASSLPDPLQRRVIRWRHERHVATNFPQLTPGAFLRRQGDAEIAEPIVWLSPTGKPPVPESGLGRAPLSPEDTAAIRAWLVGSCCDSDGALADRMDNHGDELGRTRSALRTRLALSGALPTARRPRGGQVLVDARSLQAGEYANRGIGRFAAAVALGLRAAFGDARIEFLIDPGLDPLPAELRGSCALVTRLTDASQLRYAALVQPSPMTASPDPVVPLLRSDAHTIAVVYDFIPAHYPSVYLAHPAACAEYAAALDALRMYDSYACISHTVRDELERMLGDAAGRAAEPELWVAWPRAMDAEPSSTPAAGTGPIVVMTGDEPRKNTYGALAAIGAATAGVDAPRDVVVVGMAGQADRVHHWSIHAAMRPGETRTAPRLSETEMREMLRQARLVIVPSFDEGLSLPVIEAVRAGARVIASDIPAHRELLGRGRFLFAAEDVKHAARVIRRHLRRGTARDHSRRLAEHQHVVLEDVLTRAVSAAVGRTEGQRPGAEGFEAAGRAGGVPEASMHVTAKALRLAFATPWIPQATGVADFSATIGRALSERCDVTVFTTGGASPTDGFVFRSVDEVLADPRGVGSEFDAFVSVIGNSHFHIPFVEMLRHVDAVSVLHDTRMIEFYLALLGPGGVENLMLRGQERSSLQPMLDEQVRDMRLLQNAGLWEIARRSRAIVLHAASAAGLVASQTGVVPHVLPFATQRVPEQHVITEELRADARERLGWRPERTYLTTFGFVDVRTKLSDLVIEAGAWLTQWGHDVEVRLAGAAPGGLADDLVQQAEEAGVPLTITGFLDEGRFRDHLLATDVGVQLRVSPLLGVSGPLSDLAAWGTPAVASAGLASDVGAPPYVARVPEEASPVQVAEAVETLMAGGSASAQHREEQRREYLRQKSPGAYADALLSVVREAFGA